MVRFSITGVYFNGLRAPRHELIVFSVGLYQHIGVWLAKNLYGRFSSPAACCLKCRFGCFVSAWCLASKYRNMELCCENGQGSVSRCQLQLPDRTPVPGSIGGPPHALTSRTRPHYGPILAHHMLLDWLTGQLQATPERQTKAAATTPVGQVLCRRAGSSRLSGPALWASDSLAGRDCSLFCIPSRNDKRPQYLSFPTYNTNLDSKRCTVICVAPQTLFIKFESHNTHCTEQSISRSLTLRRSVLLSVLVSCLGHAPRPEPYNTTESPISFLTQWRQQTPLWPRLPPPTGQTAVPTVLRRLSPSVTSAARCLPTAWPLFRISSIRTRTRCFASNCTRYKLILHWS